MFYTSTARIIQVRVDIDLEVGYTGRFVCYYRSFSAFQPSRTDGWVGVICYPFLGK